jgi:hypothetical protein
LPLFLLNGAFSSSKEDWRGRLGGVQKYYFPITNALLTVPEADHTIDYKTYI